MKGVSGLPPIVIQGAFAALVILGILVGGSAAVNDFVKKEALDINADRIATTALTMNSMENGSTEIDISKYDVKVEEGNITLRYRGEKAERKLEDSTGFEELQGPKEWITIDEEVLCLKSMEGTFNVTTGEC